MMIKLKKEIWHNWPLALLCLTLSLNICLLVCLVVPDKVRKVVEVAAGRISAAYVQAFRLLELQQVDMNFC